jgi:hypothetical protein
MNLAFADRPLDERYHPQRESLAQPQGSAPSFLDSSLRPLALGLEAVRLEAAEQRRAADRSARVYERLAARGT